jgi:hypothetical protein
MMTMTMTPPQSHPPLQVEAAADGRGYAGRDGWDGRVRRSSDYLLSTQPAASPRQARCVLLCPDYDVL